MESKEITNSHDDDKISREKEEHFEKILNYSANMTRSLFANLLHSYADGYSIPDSRSTRRRDLIKRIKTRDLYGEVIQRAAKSSHPLVRPHSSLNDDGSVTSDLTGANQKQLVSYNGKSKLAAPETSIVLKDTRKTIAQTRLESVAKSARFLVVPWMNAIDKKNNLMQEIIKPEWHPPWKLYAVINRDGGWVHSLAVEPRNMWFASGCRNGLIKITDIASGKLRITLTNHISSVRGLAVSDRHPYLFSCGDDKKVLCWDLEQNKVVRDYHGHLSGVYGLALHPTENLLVTGGRDSVARVWDMRTKEQVYCLTGHSSTVGSILCLENDPQIITGSYDTTIRLWDIRLGKTITTLTNHKKSIRALAVNHDKTAFASGAADNIKQWSLPDGKFIQNLSGHDSIVNCLAANQDNVLVSGADDGTLFFWDWRTGYNFQKLTLPVQRGSIESEASVLATTFDRSGARLITGQSDKTMKMLREDPKASEETHPIDWKPDIMRRSNF